MELSAAFEERVRQMEDARNHRLSLLHAEKELQAAKSRLLGAKAAAARRLERRRLLLERRAADLASRALAARADIDAARARRLAVSRDLSVFEFGERARAQLGEGRDRGVGAEGGGVGPLLQGQEGGDGGVPGNVAAVRGGGSQRSAEAEGFGISTKINSARTAWQWNVLEQR